MNAARKKTGTEPQAHLAQARIDVELDRQVGALADRQGVSRSDFFRTALVHEVQRLTQTRPARPVSLEDLQRQLAALATQIESMQAHQVRADLVLEHVALALGVNPAS